MSDFGELLKDLRELRAEVAGWKEGAEALSSSYATERALAYQSVLDQMDELIEAHTPEAAIEEPMKVGAKVINIGGNLFERVLAADAGAGRRHWNRTGTSAFFTWDEIVVKKVLFEGYDT